MAKKPCKFNPMLLIKFRDRKVNEQEMEQVENHLCKCQQCRNNFAFLAVFGDRIITEINQILDEEDDGATDW